MRTDERWPDLPRRLSLLAAGLVVVNLVNNTVLQDQPLLVGLVEVVLLLGFARWVSMDRAELGLARETWATGLRWAGMAVLIVAVGYAVALALPATRDLFLDRRAQFSIGQAIFAATVPAFVRTVLLEELAFRGVLWGLLCRLRGAGFATVVSSVLFGLWHVLPAMDLTTENKVAGELIGAGPAAAVTAVVFGVISTTLAGLVFGELRRRTGSLLAPIGLHWATNGLGYILAAVAWQLWPA